MSLKYVRFTNSLVSFFFIYSRSIIEVRIANDDSILNGFKMPKVYFFMR